MCIPSRHHSVLRPTVLIAFLFWMAAGFNHAFSNPGEPCLEDLASQFVSPPSSARPWVYWFWLNGNITREGITADLEAMARVGIGGVLIMEVDQGIPKGPVPFASPEWRELFKHVAKEAHRLGIEVNMNNDAGWCGSGGPWITPEQSMQRVVWSEAHCTGPTRFDQVLPQPPTTEGFYRDIAVLAFPAPPGETSVLSSLSPKVTTDEDIDGIDGSPLLDGDSGTKLSIPKPTPDQSRWIQLEFREPFEARCLTLDSSEGLNRLHTLIQVSSDGKDFRTLRENDFRSASKSVSFEVTSSRFWKFVFTHADSRSATIELANLDLSPKAIIENIEAKSGLVAQAVGFPSDNDLSTPGPSIPINQILNLSQYLTSDGRLTWDVPTGEWTLIRFGHTSTGRVNAPAPQSGTGLECDKLSKEGIEAQFNGLIGKLITDCTPNVGLNSGGLTMTHIDSWEVGSQNWTANFPREFSTRRNYDLLPWLPVLTGRVVGGMEQSERFLWDLRLTIGELLADNYAGHLRDLCHQHGMTLSIEAYGDCVFDNLTYAGRADLPMSEFWVGGGAMDLGKSMSSAAHTYGRQITGAESFTAGYNEGQWKQHPYSLKALGDQGFCQGINRFVVHRYAMQPWLNRVPGMTMGPWGVHYERTVTWWEQSGPWHEYLSRCQYLLQQGRFVADVCYLISEGAPNDAPPRSNLQPAIPEGYDYDACPSELASQMEVREGCVVLPSGMTYRVLALPWGNRISSTLLREVKRLTEAGAVIVGPRPTKSPSLAGYPKCDEEVDRFGKELWGDGSSTQPKVINESSLKPVFARLGLTPDFTSTPGLRYIHRLIGDVDCYFVSNPQPYSVKALCRFRVIGKQPEFWWPDSGLREDAPLFEEKEGLTTLPIRLGPSGSVFVVFGKPNKNANPFVAFSRDGESLIPTQDSQVNITIVKALYGILNDPARTRDVTARIQSLVAVGNTQIRVADMAQGDDPAPDVVKTLSIDYKVDDRSIRVAGQDPETVFLPQFIPDIVIEKALYGILEDPTSTRDVTAKVRHLVELGEFSFQVARLAHGDDPAFGVVKTAVIECLLDGKPAKFTGMDPETICLAVPPIIETAPTAQVTFSKDMKPNLEVWQGGEYKLQTSSGDLHVCVAPDPPGPIEIEGSWDISFPPGWDAPSEYKMEKLTSLSNCPDPGVKYFSGTATYRKTVNIPDGLFAPDQRIYLNLGEVKVIAEVHLNNHALGILWKPPFILDITKAARKGNNQLVVKVTNLWTNRLIGDEQRPEDTTRNPDGSLKEWPQWLLENGSSPSGRLTFSTWKFFNKDSRLSDSGLIGPVRLVTTRIWTIP